MKDTKTCFKCDKVLPASEFYRHPNMGDGRLGKCKECAKFDVRQNRAQKRAYYNAYDRERSKRPDRILAITSSRSREKRLATVAVHNAIHRGKLFKKPCEVCGAIKVDAHHPDYSRPLDVMWLCRKHHADWHRANDPQEKAA